jgi:hypothetical protein
MSALANFLKKQKTVLRAHKTNSKGKKIAGKYLIIESDDWGAIRTPSKKVMNNFSDKGFDISNSVYKKDSLESNEDVDMLCNVLANFKDSNGNPLKFTTNTIMANPDFEKIKNSDYLQYFYEPLQHTFSQYPAHDKVLQKWIQAINNNLFVPQFHGREHLQINRWLKMLQSGNTNALYSFSQGATYSGKADYSFMEAFDWDDTSDIELHKSIITDGLQLFKEMFGFASASFIAPCYNWDPSLSTHLVNQDISIIQGARFQFAPTGTFEKYQLIPHYFGQQLNGLTYNVRNCFLEPSLQASKDWVDSCLGEIQAAFMWNKPAVICSHRINYIGFIDEKNRERGLRDLQAVIKAVLKKWPDVQFIATNQLADIF